MTRLHVGHGGPVGPPCVQLDYCSLPICSRRPVVSSGPGTLKARGNALRRTASSKHSIVGCRCAPRPGARRPGSGRTSPPDTVIRSRSAGLDRFRHPIQVRSRTLSGRASAVSVTVPRGVVTTQSTDREISLPSCPHQSHRYPAGCRSASPSAGPRAARSGPLYRSRGTTDSPVRRRARRGPRHRPPRQT